MAELQAAGGATNGIQKSSGSGTNATLYSKGVGNNNGALVLWSYTNNYDGAVVTIFGNGPTSAAIAHVECDFGKAVDFGLWASRFGSGYGGNYVFDSYDGDDITTQFGPGYKFTGTGIYSGDSGVTSHSLLMMNMTNLTFDLCLRQPDTQNGKSAFHFDATKGVVEFSSVSLPGFSGTGTFLSGNGATPTTITGSGTAFVSEVCPGSLIYDTNNVGLLVLATNSNTSILVQVYGGGSYSVTAGMPFSIQRPSAAFPGLGSASYGTFVMPSGDLLVKSISPPAVTFSRNNVDAWKLIALNGQFSIANVVQNGNVFYINSAAGDSCLGIDAAGLTSVRYGMKLWNSGIPTMSGTDVALWNSNKVIYAVSATTNRLVIDLR